MTLIWVLVNLFLLKPENLNTREFEAMLKHLLEVAHGTALPYPSFNTLYLRDLGQ